MDVTERRQSSRVDTVMASIRQRIAGRSLTPGAKLPSVRGMATAMKVSVSVMVGRGTRPLCRGAPNCVGSMRVALGG